MLDEVANPAPLPPFPHAQTAHSSNPVPQVMLEVVLLDLAPSDEADEAARADRAFNEQVRPGARACACTMRPVRPRSWFLLMASATAARQACSRPLLLCSTLLHSVH